MNDEVAPSFACVRDHLSVEHIPKYLVLVIIVMTKVNKGDSTEESVIFAVTKVSSTGRCSADCSPHSVIVPAN